MKELFQAHIPDTNQEIERVWTEALIVFDANTLLNLYRYSDSSRSEFISVLKDIRERIWVPEQAALEYFENRAGVISEQSKSYEVARKTIKELRDALRKDRGHPFVKDKTMKSLLSTLEKVEVELDKNQDLQISRIPSDDIMREIVGIFDGRVGEKLSNAQLDQIFEEGAERYKQKIPPGYRDAAKHESPFTLSEKRRVFGDLVLWKQIINKAKDLEKHVIFVTDDAKDDWWLEAQGKTIGPRVELIEEFFAAVGQKFYMYRPDQFLKYAKEHLHSEISGEAIAEIRATDESRVSEQSRSRGFDEAGIARWLKVNGQRDKFSEYSKLGDTDRERSSHKPNYISKFAIGHRLAKSKLEDLQAEQEVVRDKLSRIGSEIKYITDRLTEMDASENLDIDEVEALKRSKDTLERVLQVQRRRLVDLGNEIRLAVILDTDFD